MSARPSDENARQVQILRAAIEATRNEALRQNAVNAWYAEQRQSVPASTAACRRCRECISKPMPKDDSSSSSSDEEGK